MSGGPERLPTPVELGLPGHYEVLRQMAVGRAGRVVYLARHQFLERQVCIKVWPLVPDPSGAGLERFTREARVASCMSHSNIVSVYDYGRTERRAAFAPEYVTGGNLGFCLPWVGRGWADGDGSLPPHSTMVKWASPPGQTLPPASP
jgi:serine/threonine protein kinase